MDASPYGAVPPSEPPPRVIAALGPKMLAEDDPVKMEMDIVDEQVDTLGRACCRAFG